MGSQCGFMSKRNEIWITLHIADAFIVYLFDKGMSQEQIMLRLEMYLVSCYQNKKVPKMLFF